MRRRAVVPQHIRAAGGDVQVAIGAEFHCEAACEASNARVHKCVDERAGVAVVAKDFLCAGLRAEHKQVAVGTERRVVRIDQAAGAAGDEWRQGCAGIAMKAEDRVRNWVRQQHVASQHQPAFQWLVRRSEESVAALPGLFRGASFTAGPTI